MAGFRRGVRDPHCLIFASVHPSDSYLNLKAITGWRAMGRTGKFYPYYRFLCSGQVETDGHEGEEIVPSAAPVNRVRGLSPMLADNGAESESDLPAATEKRAKVRADRHDHGYGQRESRGAPCSTGWQVSAPAFDSVTCSQW